MKYKAVPVKKRGSWLYNIAYKPEVILAKLTSSNDDVVWIDADASFEEKPELFERILPEFDIAFYTLDWVSWCGDKKGRQEVFNGTIFFRNNEKVKNFVRKWFYRTKNGLQIGEHEHFEDMANDKSSDLKIFPLPIEYAYIYSLPNGAPPLIKIDKPVIVHHQASRRYRRTTGVL